MSRRARLCGSGVDLAHHLQKFEVVGNLQVQFLGGQLVELVALRCPVQVGQVLLYRHDWKRSCMRTPMRYI